MDDRSLVLRNATSTQLFAGLLDSRIPSIYRHRDVAYPRIGKIITADHNLPTSQPMVFLATASKQLPSVAKSRERS